MERSQDSEPIPTEASNEDNYQRRREQVRRAQRTHRDRKTTYVKSLETEVAELRARAAAYEAAVAAAQKIIHQLKGLLLSHGFDIPPELQEAQDPSPLATIELVGRTFHGQKIEAYMPEYDASAPCPYHRERISMTGSESEFRDSGLPSNDPSSLSVSSAGLAISSDEGGEANPGGHPQGLDAPQVGVNFVLALEQPCLWHWGAMSPELLTQGSVGTAHEAMLSSPIMARAPNFSFNPLSFGRAAGATWNVPALELERLLGLSN